MTYPVYSLRHPEHSTAPQGPRIYTLRSVQFDQNEGRYTSVPTGTTTDRAIAELNARMNEMRLHEANQSQSKFTHLAKPLSQMAFFEHP